MSLVRVPCRTSLALLGLQLLDGSGFETQTHNVESENTLTFILINFAAGSLRNVILDHRHVFLARFEYKVLEIDQYFHLSLYKMLQFWVSLEYHPPTHYYNSY